MDAEVRSTSPRGLLTLLGLRGIGPQTVVQLAARFATLRALREAAPEDLGGIVSGAARRSLEDGTAWNEAESRAMRVLEEADRLGVRLLSYADEAYPVHLRELPDRPPVVYVRGTLPGSPRTVACIGTREPSHFGHKATRGIVEFLSERGWSIVSGLALGVDTLAHETALAAGGHTVAVLANGLDGVYPKKNAGLADRILDAGGAWLSEQPFGTPAIPRNLVQRDRLQSGMSLGTVVMQTDVVGGSMHTVRFTLLQRRQLFAPVPQGAHADETKSRGILALTKRSGAELSRLLEARGDYADLLNTEFSRRPVAVPLASRDDYDVLFEKLEQAISKPQGGSAARRGPQLELF